MKTRTAFLLLPLVFLAGCATTEAPARGSRDVITAEELRQVRNLDVYQAVQQLRPSMFRRRRVTFGEEGPVPMKVYVDFIRVDGVDALREIPAAQVRRIEYLDAGEATLRFGTNHGGGALLVTSVSAAG